jgi:hypothetical protein
MRNGAIIGAVALGTMVAQHAVAQECDGCKWSLIVSSATLATTDLYPAGDSREACERLAEQARAAQPAAAAADVAIECLDSSALDAWSHDHFPDARPSK